MKGTRDVIHCEGPAEDTVLQQISNIFLKFHYVVITLFSLFPIG